MSPATTELLARILPISCDPEAIQIITGGPRQAELLLEQKFDYIFFTGGSRVGQVVALAAAKFLTPVTLELGGKSPCIVDQNVDPDVVAKRIAWAKFVNAGQTCIAPDYVLVHHKVATAFVASLQKAIKELYGLEPKTNSHYARIINASNLKRLQGVLQHQLASNPDTVVYGGAIDEKDRYIEPTIVAFVGKDPIANPIMAEEIFGPLLPIIEVQDVDEALRYVNSR